MSYRKALGRAIKDIRKAKGLTQEDFSTVSSQTYLSTLERGLKSPTVDMLEVLAERMGVHIVSILTLAYMYENSDSTVESIQDVVEKDISQIKSKAI